MSRDAPDPRKQPAEFRAWCWAKWPLLENWPVKGLTIYEAAAYTSVSWQSLRRACQKDRAGQAALAHQRFGTAYRFARADLETFNHVSARVVA